jgi:hypothetical protein
VRRVDIAGRWTGTLETSTYAPETVNADLAQAASGAITGTWIETSQVDQAQGTITGTVDDDSFAGTITYTFGPGFPTCSGSFTGPAATDSLTWSAPTFTGNCGLAPPGNPTNIRFVLRRR